MRRAAVGRRFGLGKGFCGFFIGISDQFFTAECPNRLYSVAGVVDMVDVVFEFVFPFEGGAALGAVKRAIV